MNQWFRVKTISPVHIGSGEEWFRDIDYFSTGGNTWFVALDKVGVLGEAFADEIARGGRIREIVEMRRIDPAKIAGSHCAGSVEASKLRLAVRAGDGRALLPGSSVKGALRTLFLVAWTADEPHGRRRAAIQAPLHAALQRGRTRDLEDAVFRAPQLREPKGDVLRGLKVGDAHFPADAVEVRSAKALGTARTTLAAVEALAADSCAALRVTLERPGALPGLDFPNDLPSNVELAHWSKQHAAHLLRRDRDYFRNNDVADLVRRCDELLNIVAHLPAAAIVLRLGWGIGWTGTTGDILDDRERGQLRMRLGKTRKIVLAGHSGRSDPADLWGWITLEPVDADTAQSLVPAPPAPVAAPQVPEAEPALPAVDLDEVFLNRLRQFKASDFGQLNQLVAEAERHAKRDVALAELGKRLAVVFDKKKIKQILAKFPALAPHLKVGGA